MFKDINHLKGITESLNQTYIINFIENLLDGVVFVNQDGSIAVWNHAMEEITGIPKEKATQKLIWEILFPLNIDEVTSRTPLKQLEHIIGDFFMQKENNTVGREKRYIKRADGNIRYVEIVWAPICLSNGFVLGCIVKDLTETTSLYETIVKQRNRAETLLEITSKLNSNLNVEDIIQTVCLEVSRVLNAKMVSFDRYDKSSNDFFRMFGFGIPNNVNDKLIFAKTFIYRKISSRKPIKIIKNIQRYKEFPWIGLLKELEIRIVVLVGVYYNEELLGVLNIYSSQRETNYQLEDLDFLQSIALKTGIAIYNSQLLEAETLLRKKLQKLSNQVLSIQEEERKRISRELHDEAGQALTGLKYNLCSIQNHLIKKYEEQFPQFDEAVELVNYTLRQIQTLAKDLRPPALNEIGLHLIFKDYCQNFSSRTGININYDGIEIDGLPDTLNICFYRLLQESLTNIAKHSKARNVQVRLNYFNGKVHFTVVDDGQGINYKNLRLSTSKGIGIISMKERVEMLNGFFNLHSEVGQGTVINAWIPWEVIE